MASTTPNYGWAVPTSTDLVRDGATAVQTLGNTIDSFIAGSSGAGKLFNIVSDVTGLGGTTSSASYSAISGFTTTFTTGKSGMFAVVVSARITNGGATTISYVAPQLSGAVTESASDNKALIGYGTAFAGASQVYFYDGTPNTSCTVAMYSKNSTGTTTLTTALGRIQVVTFG